MSKLHISDDLSLPIDAVTQKFSILGRTGSGKSYCATKLCEEMLDAKAQVIALDPVGVWYGLRVGGQRDVASSSYEIPIFGGLHGDVPLEPAAGEFIANLIVDRGISAVLDVSQFESDAQKARFAKDFATRFFFRKKSSPSAVHLFLEEAQEFVPQNPQRDEALMLHAFHRIAKLGRNFGIGATLITQRPQEVNKKALNQTECLLAFQMTGPQERKAIESWIAEKGVNEDIVSVLPHLKVGECHVWSPQWLEISETIKIAKKKTADVSSTPKSGDTKRVEPKALSQAELEKFSAQMLETVERAKQEDPKALRAEVQRLKRELETKTETKAPKSETKRVEVPVLKDGQIDRLEKLLDFSEWLKRFGEVMSKVSEPLSGRLEQIQKALAPVNEAVQAVRSSKSIAVQTPPAKVFHANPKSVAPPIVKVREPETASPARETRTLPGTGDLPPRRQRILDALLFFESLGYHDAAREWVAFFCDTSPNSSTYEKDCSAMRSGGLITYPNGGRLQLTAEGRGLAKPTDPITLPEFHAKVERLLPPRRQKIARVLIDVYPEALRRDQLAEKAGMSEASSTFEKDLSGMRTAGLLVYPQPNYAQAADLLFPPLPGGV